MAGARDESTEPGSSASPATTTEEAGHGHSLGTRTIRGMFWAYGSYVGGRILVLLTIAILARLLSPRDFGLVALALTFTALLETIKDFGLGQALIVGTDRDIDARSNTAFWYGLGIGTAGCCVTIAAAHWITQFYDEPRLFPVLLALSLNFPLKALGATHEALAQRMMDFRLQTVAQISNVIVRGIVGIGLALAGAGVWALVISYLVGTFTWTVMLWVMVKWRPRLRFPRGHARELFTFGGILTGVDVLHGVWASADALVIGRVLGASMLGVYTLGVRLPELLIINLSVVAASVLFPAFSKVTADRLAEVLRMALRYTMLIGAPIAAGMIVLGDAIVPALFGGQWAGAIDPMRVIAVYALLLTLEIPGGTVFKVTGRAGMLLKLAIPRTIALYVALILFAHHGLVAVAACLAGVTATFAVISIGLACRATGARPRDLAAACWAPFVAAVGAGAAMWVATEPISGDWPRIIVGVAVGALIYVALLWVTARDAIDYILRKTFPRLARA